MTVKDFIFLQGNKQQIHTIGEDYIYFLIQSSIKKYSHNTMRWCDQDIQILIKRFTFCWWEEFNSFLVEFATIYFGWCLLENRGVSFMTSATTKMKREREIKLKYILNNSTALTETHKSTHRKEKRECCIWDSCEQLTLHWLLTFLIDSIHLPTFQLLSSSNTASFVKVFTVILVFKLPTQLSLVRHQLTFDVNIMEMYGYLDIGA